MNRSLAKALGLKHPLVVAPMAGGPTTPALVIAASEAGALGSIGAAYLNADAIHEVVRQVRAGTLRPFGINLFVPSQAAQPSPEQVDRAIRKTQKFRDELKLPRPALRPPYEEDFDRQFEAVLALKPAVLSFVFGTLPKEHMGEAKKRQLLIVGTATTPDEAFELEASGVDAVVLQGVEAGGHRGIFDPKADDPNVAARDLLSAVNGKIGIPVIAAGGIMTRKHIQEALGAGADAVQMGTAFLATSEAGTSSPYRRSLMRSGDRTTKLTRAFSGRLARGLVNRFMEEMDADPGAILPYPAQNTFTRDLRKASVAADSPDCLSLWCGSGHGELWTGSTAELIKRLLD